VLGCSFEKKVVETGSFLGFPSIENTSMKEPREKKVLKELKKIKHK
jgi:hypothetical protein